MTMVRVVVADDHPIVRSGIRELLERTVDIEVIGEASTGKEALKLVREMVPDILLLDMQLPDMQGIEVARELHQSGSTVKILVLSAHDDPYYIQELLENGAQGYLVKEEAPEVLIDAVRGIAQGQQGWISRSIAAHMVSWVRDGEGASNRFTPREMSVLRLITEGKTNQQIAAAMGISEKTIEKHVSSIFQKIGVASRTEVAVYAVREGIV